MWKYVQTFTFLVSWLLLCGVPSVLSASQIEPDDRAPCLTIIGQASAPDTPVTIISDHIRRQGYPCDAPRQAEHDQQASRPNEAVWFLRCKNASYRVTLIPDMAARVEVVK